MASRFKIIPMWYWVIAVLAILWELMGCAAFVMDVITYNSLYETWLADALERDNLDLPSPPQLETYLEMLPWQWIVYGAAVTTGLLGAICLLLRSRNATIFLGLSVLFALVQFGYTFLATPILSRMPASQALPLPVAIIVIGIALMQVASIARRRAWLRQRIRS